MRPEQMPDPDRKFHFRTRIAPQELLSNGYIRRPQGRLGIVLQEKVRPILKQQSFALADNLKDVVVPGLKPFPHFLVGLVPVGLPGRFLAANSRTVTVSHPPEL